MVEESSWQRVKEIFQAVLEQPEQQREAYLDQACDQDPDLRKQVETLLRYNAEAGGFIEAPVAGAAAELLLGQVEDLPEYAIEGQRIGPYEVLKQLGEGGMGAVYLAERADAAFHKQVAIKLIRGGARSQDIVGRFQTERQVLASLEHPNIARLIDGGTTGDGRPFLVMEFVEGVPIDVYCDRERLPTRARIELFRQVASAVQFAHQNLIVHRDLNPDNILVTEEGVPKLLDFGIAKLLDPAAFDFGAEATVTELRPMTPEYASPEQVRGDPVTTASDIYALGVLLYELLTGHRPYRLKSRMAQEMIRVICEEEPELPSSVVGRIEEIRRRDGTTKSLSPHTVSLVRDGDPASLRRRLLGDLDNIVLMALSKEAKRRYSSVEQLSEDLRRHLEALPVLARRSTFAYRVQKFVRRHRLGVSAAAAILLALIGGLGATLWQARRAEAAQLEAEDRFLQVRRLANSLLFEIHGAIADVPGATAARGLLVERALEYLDQLSEEAAGDPVFLAELAEGYTELGDIQGAGFESNLGDKAAAQESYLKALEMRQTLHRALGDAAASSALAQSYEKVADTRIFMGETESALKSYQQALAIRQELVDRDPADQRRLKALAQAYSMVGRTLSLKGDTEGALQANRRYLETHQQRQAAAPDDPKVVPGLGTAHMRYGDMLWRTGSLDEAESHFEETRRLFELWWRNSPESAHALRAMAIAQMKLGDIHAMKAEYETAIEHFQTMLERVSELVEEDPDDVQVRRDQAVAYMKLGDVYTDLGDGSVEEALDHFRRGKESFEHIASLDTANVDAVRDVVGAQQRLGSVLYRVGRTAEALDHLGQSVSKARDLAARDPESALYRFDLSVYITSEADVHRDRSDWRRAAKGYREALELRRELVTQDPTNAPNRHGLAESLENLAQVESHLGSSDEQVRVALALYREALGCWQALEQEDQLPPKGPDSIARIQREIATLGARLGDG